MNLQEELKALKERIAELEEQAEEEQDFPQKYDDYWYVDDDTEVLGKKWHNSEYDEGRLSIDNIFKTRERAEFAVEKLKVEAELRKFGKRFESWKCNFTIGLDYFYEELTIESMGVANLQGVIYFESAEKVRQAIEAVGEERIKKYIFGVGEY